MVVNKSRLQAFFLVLVLFLSLELEANSCMDLFAKVEKGIEIDYFFESEKDLKSDIQSVGARLEKALQEGLHPMDLKVPERMILVYLYKEQIERRREAMISRFEELKNETEPLPFHLKPLKDILVAKLELWIINAGLFLGRLKKQKSHELTLRDINEFSEIYSRIISFYPDQFDYTSPRANKITDSWTINNLMAFRGRARDLLSPGAVFFPTTQMPSKLVFNYALQFGLFLATSGLERYNNYDQGIDRNQDQLFTHDDSHWTHYIKNFAGDRLADIAEKRNSVRVYIQEFLERFPLRESESGINLAAHWLLFHHYHEDQYQLPIKTDFHEALRQRRGLEDRKKYNFSPNLENDLIETFGPNYREVIDRAIEKILE